jgi:hypothetical protein
MFPLRPHRRDKPVSSLESDTKASRRQVYPEQNLTKLIEGAGKGWNDGGDYKIIRRELRPLRV